MSTLSSLRAEETFSSEDTGENSSLVNSISLEVWFLAMIESDHN